jgi:hypothetical protein
MVERTTNDKLEEQCTATTVVTVTNGSVNMINILVQDTVILVVHAEETQKRKMEIQCIASFACSVICGYQKNLKAKTQCIVVGSVVVLVIRIGENMGCLVICHLVIRRCINDYLHTETNIMVLVMNYLLRCKRNNITNAVCAKKI